MKKRSHELGFFSDPLTTEAISDLVGSDDVLFFVGAGVSMDQNLPSWSSLVANLLRASIESRGLGSQNVKIISGYLVDQLFQVPTAAIVDALFLDAVNGDRDRAVKARNQGIHRILYANQNSLRSPSLAEKILMAALELRAAGKTVTIVTTNYDDVLERTCEASPKIYERVRQLGLQTRPVWDNRELPTSPTIFPIIHVHGYLPSDWDGSSGGNPALTFSEEDYVRWDERSAYRSELIRRFSTSTVLLAGSSLRDHNIERALSLGQAPHHNKWALLPIHDQVSNLSVQLQEHWPTISDLIAERGYELRTTILQPDFYGQVYQFFTRLRQQRATEPSSPSTGTALTPGRMLGIARRDAMMTLERRSAYAQGRGRKHFDHLSPALITQKLRCGYDRRRTELYSSGVRPRACGSTATRTGRER